MVIAAPIVAPLAIAFTSMFAFSLCVQNPCLFSLMIRKILLSNKKDE